MVTIFLSQIYTHFSTDFEVSISISSFCMWYLRVQLIERDEREAREVERNDKMWMQKKEKTN